MIGHPSVPDYEHLTKRERVVLRQTVHGYNSTEIGNMLGISPKTVDTYRSRVMKKLHFSHRSELVRFALEQGVLRSADRPARR
jgi:two-component system response regulator NreC